MRSLEGKKYLQQASRSHRFVLQNWWLIALMALAWILYLQGLEKKRVLFNRLEKRVSDLQWEKETALCRQKELLLKKNSWQDTEWLELVLKKQLGVKGNKEIKIMFMSQEEANK